MREQEDFTNRDEPGTLRAPVAGAKHVAVLFLDFQQSSNLAPNPAPIGTLVHRRFSLWLDSHGARSESRDNHANHPLSSSHSMSATPPQVGHITVRTSCVAGDQSPSSMIPPQ
jgi:hypothetical protein